MKEQLLEAFDSLGFKLEEEENLGYSFTYEGLNLLFMYNEDDTDFLSIALPGIFAADDGNAALACALMEKINASLKYVKANLFGSNVWMFYERELMGGEDLQKVISRMILHLEADMLFVRKTIAELTSDSSDDEAGDAAEEPVADESKDDNNDE